ncbi:MAG: argininosuccinate synthase [Actinomycetota bacterium]|nr:argininosuccinate synthase [Actinomycetota bacterium]MDK1016095.1 argininosuccinate synthase [Actinomycetota bacterium]MDK1025826.1 argininosuccinate synthase [Actinomycetota bacterium]MDK1038264.1 argininosuccinate synthase [Actinomycetota bacterium]MDK1097010.1 argininosuccinate synthase [Actinomycetota bacterium]
MDKSIRKVVLAYSGGLDTSVILRWIKEEYGAEVITYTADVGQGEETEEARVKALATGASQAICEDLTAEFVSDYVFPAFRASALYEGYYHMGTSLARPVISKGLVRAAVETGADAIAHGATGKGNDQVRFELSAYALKPDIKVIAPWREWKFKGRADLVAYAEEHGIPIPVTPEKPYSMDANLLHISYEGGVLEDPWQGPPAEMFEMTVSPEDAPDEPEFVTIGYEHGDPVSIDGVRMSPVELLTRANELGGKHGIGRVDMVENRFVGMKSRGVYETPGGTILYHAHRAVESLTLDREVAHLRDELSNRYAEMVYNGFWFAPEREALQSFMDDVQKPVTGEARMKLYKGQAIVDGRRSDSHDLYDEATVTFEADDVYDQADAGGFIRLQSLRLRTFAEKRLGEGE